MLRSDSARHLRRTAFAIAFSLAPPAAQATMAQEPRSNPPGLPPGLPPSLPDAELATETRVATIGYRLARSSAGRCDTPEMMTGALIYDVSGYAQSERAAIARIFALTQGFAVRGIVPDSAAAEAGLRIGDVIVMSNGTDLSRFAPELIRRRASFDRTERFIDTLAATLGSGPAQLIVLRNGVRMPILLTGVAGCSARFTIADGDQRNAWSDGRYVAVTKGLIAIADDDALAFILAHEMAHNLLHHADRLGKAARPLAQFGLGTGKVRAFETEADRLAVTLMTDAGYHPEAGMDLLSRMAQARGSMLDLTHPDLDRRRATIDAAIKAMPPLR